MPAQPPPAPPRGSYPRPPPPSGGGAYPPAGGVPGPAASTNGMAIASLVCSVVGAFLCGIGSIVGIVLGVIALNQIKQTGQGGRGMALAGIIVGAVALVAGLIWVVIYFF